MLESAFICGVLSAGADCLTAGVIPTPAVSALTVLKGCGAGVVVSASHNPGEYNGLKVFDSEGYKLSEGAERELEYEMAAMQEFIGGKPGRVYRYDSAQEDYVGHILSFCGFDLSGKEILLDCAYGAMYEVAPEVFRRLGAQIVTAACKSCGELINAGCGAANTVKARDLSRRLYGKAAVFCYDGDGDRVIAFQNGEAFDGDRLLYILALHLKKSGRLIKNTVVGTLMSNCGLEKSLAKEGITLLRADVGDRNVLELMRREGLTLGGEQSGHIVLSEYARTGDGLLTSVIVMGICQKEKADLRTLAAGCEYYPQILLSVPNSDPQAAVRDGRLIEKAEFFDKELGDSGRINIRASGTEPKVRIMVEGADEGEIRALAENLAEIVRKY